MAKKVLTGPPIGKTLIQAFSEMLTIIAKDIKTIRENRKKEKEEEIERRNNETNNRK